jgi:hypothetical protein
MMNGGLQDAEHGIWRVEKVIREDSLIHNDKIKQE